jgi:hypothetical protein
VIANLRAEGKELSNLLVIIAQTLKPFTVFKELDKSFSGIFLSICSRGTTKILWDNNQCRNTDAANKGPPNLQGIETKYDVR